MYLKKVYMVRLPNGIINLIPLEEIQDCKIITPDEKTDFWVHEKTTPGGADYGLGDHNKVRNLRQLDITFIVNNGGECFVETDHQNKLAMPRNALGYKKVVIHLSPIKEVVKV